MIELPEAVTLARQLDTSVRGERVTGVIAGGTPHKMAWFHDDPRAYPGLLGGTTLGPARQRGGYVEIDMDDARLLVAEGVALRLHAAGAPRPDKHQLLLELAGGSALSASVQMYGGVWAFRAGTFDNAYYRAACTAPSPLTPAFDREHWHRLLAAPKAQKGSVKGLLATEQRIPGLGNGVLQDILLAARLHPRRKVGSLNDDERGALYDAITSTLAQMAERGGRDTERDLYGRPGGYRTKLSRNTAGGPCAACGSVIVKETYMGGAIYVCPGCQRDQKGAGGVHELANRLPMY